MKQFLIVLRGSLEAWAAQPEATQNTIRDRHAAWFKRLYSEGRLKSGAELNMASRKLVPTAAGIIDLDRPYKATQEALSGYFIIEAENIDEAVAIASTCPALENGESVEVAEIA